MDSINRIAKASILSTLLMGSAALYATKPITNSAYTSTFAGSNVLRPESTSMSSRRYPMQNGIKNALRKNIVNTRRTMPSRTLVGSEYDLRSSISGFFQKAISVIVANSITELPEALL